MQTKPAFSLVLIFAILGGYIFLCVVFPSMPKIPCFYKSLLNVECPGCGLTRAAMAIMQGEFRMAWALNPTIYLYLIGALGVLYHCVVAPFLNWKPLPYAKILGIVFLVAYAICNIWRAIYLYTA